MLLLERNLFEKWHFNIPRWKVVTAENRKDCGGNWLVTRGEESAYSQKAFVKHAHSNKTNVTVLPRRWVPDDMIQILHILKLGGVMLV